MFIFVDDKMCFTTVIQLNLFLIVFLMLQISWSNRKDDVFLNYLYFLISQEKIVIYNYCITLSFFQGRELVQKKHLHWS